MKKIAAVFRDGTNYKVFLLSVFIIGLGYGIHKGLLDNYLAEIVGIGEFELSTPCKSSRQIMLPFCFLNSVQIS